jgi:omega-amidase
MEFVIAEWKPPERDFRFCGIQARLFSRDWHENQRELLDMFAALPDEEYDLIVTPEASNLYYHYDLIRQLQGGEEIEFIAPFAEIARERGAHVLLGSLMVRDGDCFRNRLHLLSPEGSVVGTYDKVHLIRLFDEHLHFTPGEKLFTAEVAGWKLGFAICYDLRFAEMFLNYALMGCHLQVLPSCWPDTRVKHWHHLYMARAQETQCFFAGVNHGGTDAEGRAYRMSLVADPDCETLAELPDAEPDIITAVLRPESLVKQKQLYDLMAGRKPFPYA